MIYSGRTARVFDLWACIGQAHKSKTHQAILSRPIHSSSYSRGFAPFAVENSRSPSFYPNAQDPVTFPYPTTPTRKSINTRRPPHCPKRMATPSLPSGSNAFSGVPDSSNPADASPAIPSLFPVNRRKTPRCQSPLHPPDSATSTAASPAAANARPASAPPRFFIVPGIFAVATPLWEWMLHPRKRRRAIACRRIQHICRPIVFYRRIRLRQSNGPQPVCKPVAACL